MGTPLWLSVIGTAIALGIVHVMTGPDHLSALSTLAVGKPLRAAFGLGVRWGCGHSFGLLIVAIIFFAVGQSINLDTLEYYADIFVGIFMILLGSWYTVKAFRERMRYLQDQEVNDHNELLEVNGKKIDMDEANNDAYDMSPIQHMDNGIQKEQIELQSIEDDKKAKMIENHDEPEEEDVEKKKKKKKQHSDSDSDDVYCFDHPFVRKTIHSEASKLNNKSYQNDEYHDAIPDDDIIIDANASLNPLFDPSEDREEKRRTKCITRIAAFIAGIFAGIAGPGGVLGVMMALKLNDWFFSSLYLVLFFISSILTMGLYATMYGYCTQRMTVCANNKQKCAYILKMVSAIFSLAVGVLWIALTFNGTLQKWFS
eukprot:268596_1